jgi:ribosomal protein S24E
MEIKITNEQQNPLFNRKEVFGTVNASSSPTKDEVAKELASKFKVETTALRVLDVKGKYGSQEFTVRANIYPTQEERNKVEKLTKKEKEAEAKAAEPAPEEAAPAENAEAPASEEPAAEEAPKEEAPAAEEKPAEEPAKEETKPEEKTE